MRLLSYNMAQKQASWQAVTELDVDVALLQEICRPPSMINVEFAPGAEPWKNTPALGEVWKCAVAKMSDRVRVRWFAPHIAEVTAPDQEPILVVSLYGRWLHQHPAAAGQWIYADASVHERISELSAFIGSRDGHRIIAAGDLNILYGYGERGDLYWKGRYQTIFDRMEALGLTFVGPQHPNGRQADPWPDELPRDSANVPTYHTMRSSPAGATRQLDYVFASESIAERVTVRAMNGVEKWGPSDHARVVVEVGE